MCLPPPPLASYLRMCCRSCAVLYRSKAASTLADVLSGIQSGRSGYRGEAFRRAVLEACGWGAAEGGPRRDGPLLEIVRTRVEVSAMSVLL